MGTRCRSHQPGVHASNLFCWCARLLVARAALDVRHRPLGAVWLACSGVRATLLPPEHLLPIICALGVAATLDTSRRVCHER